MGWVKKLIKVGEGSVVIGFAAEPGGVVVKHWGLWSPRREFESLPGYQEDVEKHHVLLGLIQDVMEKFRQFGFEFTGQESWICLKQNVVPS